MQLLVRLMRRLNAFVLQFSQGTLLLLKLHVWTLVPQGAEVHAQVGIRQMWRGTVVASAMQERAQQKGKPILLPQRKARGLYNKRSRSKLSLWAGLARD